jgi:hypothetical protein
MAAKSTNRAVLIAIGLFLAILGGLGLMLGDVSYSDERGSVDIGPIEATASTRERVEIPPLAAGAVLVIGVGTIVFGISRDGWRA